MDPDNDYRANIARANNVELLKTNNYVRYQKGYPSYEHPTQPNTALVCSCGMLDFNAVVCAGAVHPSVSVKIGGIAITRISQVTTGLYANTWLPYGGKDVTNTPAYQSRMHYFDESIHVVFQLGTLAPGESTTITTANVMQPGQLSQALNTMSGVTIIQPTDYMTGPYVTFTVGELCFVLFCFVLSCFEVVELSFVLFCMYYYVSCVLSCLL